MSTSANVKAKEKKVRPPRLRLASGSAVVASEDAPGDQHASSMEDLNNMWDTILKTINTRFDLLDEKFTSVQSSHNSLATRMDEIDGTVSDNEARLQSTETAISKLQKENAFLRAKTNELRNNVKFVGIPEGEEKGNPTEFISALIPKLLGERLISQSRSLLTTLIALYSPSQSKEPPVPLPDPARSLPGSTTIRRKRR
ncbi:hypothetical protein DPEC_G00093560 [Dallia pectoralis]|uniref:Uncharacterized protein n=1 Tax=Dallia pectoralis TaxID=75939 RepID=A0ACC2H1G4_DALPE|nr:hypothetical protein DPEC_G00093560 [Dallia pectoralis]